MQDRTTTTAGGRSPLAAPPRIAPRNSSGELLHGATRDGTARFASRFAVRFSEDFYRTGPMRLSLSSLGVGTLLGDHDDATDDAYTDTIAQALRTGINVVDTAVNFRCQRSERAAGAALRKAIDEGAVEREEVVLCSKGGYVPLDCAPPPDRTSYDEYLDREFYSRGLMTRDEVVAGGHCLSPRFLADSVRRSLENLGVPTVDVYCIHNPEQQLSAIPREELTRRMRDAFTQMEACADAGEIGSYGVASWAGFTCAPDAKEHLSLAELVKIAHEVAGDAHRFRVAQMPVSLATPDAVRVPTQLLSRRRRVSALDAAAELGLCVLATAALMQGRLVSGLPPAVHDAFPGMRSDAQRALAFARSLPNVVSVTVGMRHRTHLHENLDSARGR
jgi:aryl-alcohol dehydrogenase-like predicted oxidoreductase